MVKLGLKHSSNDFQDRISNANAAKAALLEKAKAKLKDRKSVV